MAVSVAAELDAVRKRIRETEGRQAACTRKLESFRARLMDGDEVTAAEVEQVRLEKAALAEQWRDLLREESKVAALQMADDIIADGWRARAEDEASNAAARATMERIFGGSAASTDKDYPMNSRTVSPSRIDGGEHDQARRAIDHAVDKCHANPRGAERAVRLLNSGTPHERSMAARWATVTGDDHYRSAFIKLLNDPERGHMEWTGEETRAYQAVAEWQREQRGMTTVDGAGGYLAMPFELDPVIMLTSDGSINPLRRISRLETCTTDTWRGITSAGATSEWKTEAAEVADGSPSVDKADIPVYTADTYVKWSWEIELDAWTLVNQLGEVMQDSLDQLQTTAFTTGDGSGKPTGVVYALQGTASEINGGGSEALSSADPYTLQNALPPRFQANAQFAANIAIINTLAQMETTNGALKFPELRGGQLLRKPLHELSNMDGSINAAATANNYVLLYGDFRNFVIVDRIGASFELVSNVVGSNRRPTGERGAVLWTRTGSDVVVDQAFRLLDVPTTA